MHIQLTKRKFLQNKLMHIFVDKNNLIITNEAYQKTPSKILQIKLQDCVQWQLNKQAQTLEYNGFKVLERQPDGSTKITEFRGQHIIIQQLKDYLCKYVFQHHFQDEYEILAQIGKGNYARVFSARHRITNFKIAVKCFSKSKLKQSANGLQSLYNEVKILQSLGTHENIIQFIGCYEGKKTYYIALQILEGITLYNLIKKNREYHKFQHEKIQQYMIQLLNGIKHIQERKIMHRDIKPENIIFKNSNIQDNLVIADFGLADFEDSKAFIFNKCGTPGYVAPEVANYQEKVDTKYTSICDMFSIGVIFHIFLLQQSVFVGTKFNEVLNLNKECKIDFTQKMYTELPENALDLLKKMLEKDPKRRITAQEALNHQYFQQQKQKPTKSYDFQNTSESFIKKSPMKQKQMKLMDSLKNICNLKKHSDNIDEENKTPKDKTLINSQLIISNDQLTSFVHNINGQCSFKNSLSDISLPFQNLDTKSISESNLPNQLDNPEQGNQQVYNLILNPVKEEEEQSLDSPSINKKSKIKTSPSIFKIQKQQQNSNFVYGLEKIPYKDVEDNIEQDYIQDDVQ
ncbi:protein kinase domain protein [Ichthyophthirius multifiliis]|uniref:Protein kinase domain protein n=1 Tax=Ichthyophthirius multifiliis TaxID=5932 RepID=G0R004_ICHMU|nr:protein kinase domain protein [Ichthyophthirius multifiliis]EGR29214.1 protein kinase domain protein [Ichthyophthirius multifiliis]|eukprot:XP_004030450.1 protein kinase domain protein [Ichthyophthirius multifiliis]